MHLWCTRSSYRDRGGLCGFFDFVLGDAVNGGEYGDDNGLYDEYGDHDSEHGADEWWGAAH